MANNRRVNGTTQAEVLVNFGREDRLDLDALRRLVASINRYLGKPGESSGATVGAEPAGGGALPVESARPFGAVWLLDQLWRQWGIDTALAGVLGGRRFRTDVERVLFALVADRAVAPVSKLAAAEWATRDVVVPGLAGMDKDQAMRAMDLLVDADTTGAVQEAVFFSAAHLLNLEVDLIFFDITSTYCERDGEDSDGAASARTSTRWARSPPRSPAPRRPACSRVARGGVGRRCGGSATPRTTAGTYRRS